LVQLGGAACEGILPRVLLALLCLSNILTMNGKCRNLTFNFREQLCECKAVVAMINDRNLRVCSFAWTEINGPKLP